MGRATDRTWRTFLEAMGLSDEAAIQAHASLRLRVLMLGFAPGLAYLGIAGEPWDIPGRPEVRPRVPPGSVLVAVRQTVVAGTPSQPVGITSLTRRSDVPDAIVHDPSQAADRVLDIVSTGHVTAVNGATVLTQRGAGSANLRLGCTSRYTRGRMLAGGRSR